TLKTDVVEEAVAATETTEEVTPEAVVEATPEVVEEAAPEVIEEAAPEVVVEAAPEVIEEAPSTVVEPAPVVNREDFDWDAYEKGDIMSAQSKKDLELVYDNTLNAIKDKEVVEGTVISINKREVVVNVGYKSDGVVAMSEFR